MNRPRDEEQIRATDQKVVPQWNTETHTTRTGVRVSRSNLLPSFCVSGIPELSGSGNAKEIRV